MILRTLLAFSSLSLCTLSIAAAYDTSDTNVVVVPLERAGPCVFAERPLSVSRERYADDRKIFRTEAPLTLDPASMLIERHQRDTTLLRQRDRARAGVLLARHRAMPRERRSHRVFAED